MSDFTAFFWLLVFAHFVADYPLQSNWMVRAKRTWPGLTLHVGIHLITLLVMMWPGTRSLWPQILALAGIHFAIDAFKNLMARLRPTWVVAPYLWDQGLHLISIWIVAAWMATIASPVDPWLPPTWAVIATGFLLATYVWTITERVLAHAHVSLVGYLQVTAWFRLVQRGILFVAILALLQPTANTALGILIPGGWLVPSLSTTLGRRVVLADVVVVVAVAGMVIAAL
jgi:hypothetical protein